MIIITLVTGGLTVALMAANVHRDPKTVDVDWRVVQMPPRPVIAELPSRGVIVQTVTAPGTVVPIEEAEITSQILGRVTAVPVNNGDRVHKGDVLVQLDDRDARARLESADARVERAKGAIAQAEAELERTTREMNHLNSLHGRGAVPVEELANARSAQAKAVAGLTISRAEHVEAQATRRLSQQELERTVIRAPLDGVVTGRSVTAGEIVIAGTTNLPGARMMTLTDFSKLWVRADVDEADVTLVRPGQPARIYLQADPTAAFRGMVEEVVPKGKKFDEVVSFETKVRVTSPDASLHPGMTAMVDLEVRRADAALGVPVQAVVHRRRKDLPDSPALQEWTRNQGRGGSAARSGEAQYVKIVFVVDRGIARARPVETGLSDEQRVEIRAGLTADDRVVVGPFRALDELRDGSPVAEGAAHDDGREGRAQP